MIILNRLEVASDLDAFSEGILSGFQNLVTDAVLQASQKELVLNKFEGIRNAFGFDLGLGSAGSDSTSNSSHGSGFLIRQALVGHLDAISEVVDGFLQLLGQDGKVCAGRFG